jgi:hypothetical protein
MLPSSLYSFAPLHDVHHGMGSTAGVKTQTYGQDGSQVAQPMYQSFEREKHMPYRHPSKMNTPDGARTRKVPLALTVSLTATLAALLVACGPGGEQAAGGAMSRTAARLGAVEAVLTPVAATTSGVERGDLSAAAAIDHNATTRWSSSFSDDQWLTLDFGTSKTITGFASTGKTPTPANTCCRCLTTMRTGPRSRRSTTARAAAKTSPACGQGRYLRMQGIKRSPTTATRSSRSRPLPARRPQPTEPPVAAARWSTRASRAWRSSR